MRPEDSARGLTRQRDWWVSLGIGISAVSAGFSSFAGLRSLAEATGWAAMAPLFALCVDAYALTSIRVWLTSSAAAPNVRTYAKWNAIGAILLSLAGNAVWHLISANLLAVTWPVVMAVGGIPPVILGLVSHLAALRQAGRVVPASVASGATVAPTPTEAVEPVPQPVPRIAPKSGVRTQYSAYANEDELHQAARAADAAWRAEHDGRPINRDELRKALKVSGARASAALRAMRERPDTDEQSAAS